MTKKPKIHLLQEFKKEEREVKRAEKRIKELRAQMSAQIEAAHNEKVVVLESREIKQLVISCINTIVKVSKA